MASITDLMHARETLQEIEDSLVEELRLMQRELETPKDYYSGTTPPLELSMPGKVLIFGRRNAREVLFPRGNTFRFVLAVNLKTPGRLLLDDRQFRFLPLHAVLFFPFQFHQFIEADDEELSWLFVTFETDRPDDLAALRNTPVRLNRRAVEYLAGLTRDFLSERRRQPKVNNRIVLTVALLLNELTDLAELAPGGERTALQEGSGKQQLIERVTKYVYRNIDKRIGADEIAQEVFVSASYLRFLFRKHVGIGLGTYIEEVRLNKALSLMAETELSIGQIAAEVGYESQFSFSRFFKKKLGVSPSHYRRAMNR